MKKSTFNTLLVGGGFLLGTAGIKLLTSAPVKNACVQGIALSLIHIYSIKGPILT